MLIDDYLFLLSRVLMFPIPNSQYIFSLQFIHVQAVTVFLYVFALKNDFHVLHNEYIIHSYFKYSRHYATKAYTSQLYAYSCGTFHVHPYFQCRILSSVFSHYWLGIGNSISPVKQELSSS